MKSQLRSRELEWGRGVVALTRLATPGERARPSACGASLVRTGVGSALWLWMCLCSAASAQVQLPVLAASPSQLRVDGALSEWRGARFHELGSDASGSAGVALAYDASGIFVGARVRDDAFVRSAQPSPAEDALVLRLAFPERGGFADSELWLFAGRMGESAASAALRSGKQRALRPLRDGVRVVEGPHAGGYVIEAFVPWSSFEGGDDWPFARGAVRLHDVDARGGRPSGPTSAPASLGAAKLPWLALDGGPAQALASFLRAKNLERAESKLDFVGDVRGDARAERVLVTGTFVVVSAGGTRFDFSELPVASSADVRAAELRDLTDDGKPELFLRLRQQNELGTREVGLVYALSSGSPRSVFGVELRKQVPAGHVDAELRFERAARGPTKLVIRAGEARGLTQADFVETPAGELVPIPLPWGPWRQRVYAWDGGRFELAAETANPDAAPPPAAARPVAPAVLTRSAPAEQEPAAGESPLDAYKRARNLGPRTPARFAREANVFGDARPEALAVFDRELVVTGEGLGGAGFFYLTLPVAQASDVLGLEAADLTGDGRAELLIRVRQRIGDVERHVLHAYGFAAQRVEPLLVVEVARARGAQRIDNVVKLVADKRRSVLTIQPGSARGWSASDYPYVTESLDGVAPLLLPWKDRTTRYVFERGRLVPKADAGD